MQKNIFKKIPYTYQRFDQRPASRSKIQEYDCIGVCSSWRRPLAVNIGAVMGSK